MTSRRLDPRIPQVSDGPLVVLIGTSPGVVQRVTTALGTEVPILACDSAAAATGVLISADHQTSSEFRGTLEVGRVRLDMVSYRAFIGETILQLTPIEMNIVATLARAGDRLVTFEELLRLAWDSGASGRSSRPLVHSAIKRLRQKLTDTDAGICIESVRSIGFRLIDGAPV
jgi:two-component system, OmpR family, response regulator MtrA